MPLEEFILLLVPAVFSGKDKMLVKFFFSFCQVEVSIRDSQVALASYESLTTNAQKLFIPDKKGIDCQLNIRQGFEKFL